MELDVLREDEIFIKALNILEEIMSNDTVAIYSVESTDTFMRLEVNSVPLKNKIARSLKLEDYPNLENKIYDGEIFVNTNMDPSYPAYCYPIMNNGKPVSVIIIWVAKFEQFSTYYFNLLKVICGFIQSSMVRAVLFNEFTKTEKYIPNTN